MNLLKVLPEKEERPGTEGEKLSYD